MKVYRIKNWDELYENNRTRILKVMHWIPVPNKHDGDGYLTLVERKNGAAYLGAWLAILQVASKCQERGTLMRGDGTPHTAESIARITRISADTIEAALEILTNECKWLEIIGQHDSAGIRQEGAAEAHPTDEEEKERIEEKEEKEAHAPAVVFPPAIDCPEFRTTWEKWQRYRSERKLAKLVPTSIQSKLNELGAMGLTRAVAAIEHSISNNYQGIFEPKPQGGNPKQQNRRGPNI